MIYYLIQAAILNLLIFGISAFVVMTKMAFNLPLSGKGKLPNCLILSNFDMRIILASYIKLSNVSSLCTVPAQII